MEYPYYGYNWSYNLFAMGLTTENHGSHGDKNQGSVGRVAVANGRSERLAKYNQLLRIEEVSENGENQAIVVGKHGENMGLSENVGLIFPMIASHFS